MLIYLDNKESVSIVDAPAYMLQL